MKELYTSPEMKVVCFAPVEKLANSWVNFDDLDNISLDNGNGNGGISENNLDLDAEVS